MLGLRKKIGATAIDDAAEHFYEENANAVYAFLFSGVSFLATKIKLCP